MSALAEALADSGYEAVELLGKHYVRITGRAVPWNQPEIVGPYIEEWRRGAFTRSLGKQNKIPLLPYHDSKTHPLGVSEAWEDAADGLYGTFRLLMSGAAQVAADYAERGVLSGLSIGFVAQDSEWRYAGEYNPDKGEKFMDRVVRTRARLVEVSLVSTPAFVDAVVTHVESEAVEAGNGSRSLAVRKPPEMPNYDPEPHKYEPTPTPTKKPVVPLPVNYAPPAGHKTAPDPAPDDDAVTEAPTDIDETSSLAEVISYLRWIANRLSAIEGVAGGAVVTTGSPDVAGGGVATPTEAVVP